MTKFKKAVFLTGAAARISQEVAMFDKLMESESIKLTISEKDTILGGFSSGSLNLAALNACFREFSPLDWKEYYQKQVLFPLKNEDVYTRNKKFPHIPIFDTTPLRITLNEFLKTTKMFMVRNLNFYSYVMTFVDRKGDDKKGNKKFETLWACSKDKLQENLNLSDLLMSSTAIPVAFPSQEIHCVEGETDFPIRKYYDGGTGGTFKRFEEYFGKLILENGQLDEMFIISPMREKSVDELNTVAKSIFINGEIDDDEGSLKNFLSKISMKTFMKFLVNLQEWGNEHFPVAKKIYVCIPEMPENFHILDFNNEEEQYNTVCDWVNENQDKLAIPLSDFIVSHEEYIKE